VNSSLELSELDQMIGRLFMCGMPGPKLDKDTRRLIRRFNLGGLILFSRNVEDPVQVSELCRDIQETSMDAHGLPLFISVDQEGGRVARLRTPFTEFPGNEAIGMDSNPDKRAEEFATITAKEMKLVGLNLDLAPVVDVRQGEPEDHLRGRTFGEDSRLVGRLGGIVIRTLQDKGVMAVAKHFPGLGRASKDPHMELPEIPLSKDEIEAVSLPPFQDAIKKGVAGVMTSHAIYPSLDPGTPATMSSAVLTDLLRDGLGYDGLILTDDLEMGAIAGKWGVAEGATAAFAAGADILLICEDQELFEKGHQSIRKQIVKGEIPIKRIHSSMERIKYARTRFLKKPFPPSISKVKEYFKAGT
jgi:beta-N-acetylhexosaminidase